MVLHPPIEITSRLMVGVRVAGASLSIDYGDTDRDGRTVYDIWIDLPDGSEHHIEDLRSGCQSGNLQAGLCSLFTFLGAAAEARQYRERTDRSIDDTNEKLFDQAIVDWAAANSDEITGLGLELEEATEALIEE